MYKLKVVDGCVKGLLKSGKDYAKTCIDEVCAKNLIEEGTLQETSPFKEYPINVDNTWFFEGTYVKKEK